MWRGLIYCIKKYMSKVQRISRGPMYALSCISSEMETQKGKIKNTKVQKCKRCGNVKM